MHVTYREGLILKYKGVKYFQHGGLGKNRAIKNL